MMEPRSVGSGLGFCLRRRGARPHGVVALMMLAAIAASAALLGSGGMLLTAVLLGTICAAMYGANTMLTGLIPMEYDRIGKTGMTADDESVADMLRKAHKPIMLVVNKIDNVKQLNDVYEFYNLGLGDPIGISSVNLLSLGDLLEELCKHFPDPEEEEEEDY